MRLLHTEHLVFKEFIGRNIPPYAILSHRWTEEEVSYQDFLDGRLDFLQGKCQGYGWTKITKLCEIALQRGLEWAWIDTACIDKKSSAELSEAINSMYAWYERSAECYVFLPDVPDIGDCPCGVLEAEERTANDCTKSRCLFAHAPDHAPFHEEDLAASVWFTRSWTLQELLAPRTVWFWNSSFSYIGSKHDLADYISRTTGIDHRYFHFEFRVHNASVARRMSWASKREATREEDIAYSLLGIFEINMPLLYGEGQRAFRRLQTEIIRTSSDESIFAWTHDVGGSGLLADSIAKFSHSGDIKPSNLVQRKHYEMTNKGLMLTIALPQSTLARLASNSRKLKRFVRALTPLNCVQVRKQLGEETSHPIGIEVLFFPKGPGALVETNMKLMAGCRFEGNLVFSETMQHTIIKEDHSEDGVAGYDDSDTVDVPVYFQAF